MSLRWPNSIVTKNFATPSTGSAPGLWKTSAVAAYVASGQWPVVATSDPYFEYNTLLLTGDGTNGAQNNTFLDSSVNNATITRNGNTTQGTFSPYGNLWSNYFDGSGDWLTSATSGGNCVLSGNFTVEAWVYPTSWGAYQRVISGGASTFYWSLGFSTTWGGGLKINWYDGTDYYSTAYSGSPLNTWYHLAVVRTGSTLYYYINGVQYGTSSYSSTPGNANGGYMIGNRVGATEPWYGYISNARVVLGTNVYGTSSTITVPTTPLTAVSGTSLLTCQSNRFIDNSSNNFTLTVNGNTSVQRFSPFNPTAPYDAATIGGSGYFASGAYLTVPDSTALNLSGGSYTIEGWIYPDGNYSNYNTIVAKRILGGATTAWEVYLSSSTGVLGFYNGTVYASSVTPIAKAWNHFAAVYDGTNMNLYLNGTRVLQSAMTNTNQSTPVYIGTFPTYGEQYLGYISNMRITKGAALYSGTTYTVPTSPLTTTVSSGTVSLLTNFTNAGIPDAAMMNDLETVGNAQVSTSVKKYGTGSLAFDGSGDYLIMPEVLTGQFGTGDFTVEYWDYHGSQGTNYAPQVGNLSSGTPSGTWRFGTFSNNGGLYFAYHNGSGYVDVTFGSASYNDSTWRHFAITRQSGTVRAFVNGVQVGTNQTITQDFNSTNKVIVGAELVSPTYFNGYIDDLRITKGYARYTANFTPPTAALPTY